MARFSPTLLDHSANPRNAGALDTGNAVGDADLSGRAPRVQIYLVVDRDVIAQASFTAFGCGVTIAAGSVLTELAKGRTLDECRNITGRDIADALDGIPTDKQFCADVVAAALHDAIDKYKGPGHGP